MINFATGNLHIRKRFLSEIVAKSFFPKLFIFSLVENYFIYFRFYYFKVVLWLLLSFTVALHSFFNCGP